MTNKRTAHDSDLAKENPMSNMSDSDGNRLGDQLREEIEDEWRSAPPTRVAVSTAAGRRVRAPLIAVAAILAVVAAGAFVSRVLPAEDISAASEVPSEPATPSEVDSGEDLPPQSPTTVDPPASESQCSPLAPRRLLDGSPPGRATVNDFGEYQWGSGIAALRQLPGKDILGIMNADYLPTVTGERVVAKVINVGDPGVGEVAALLMKDQCVYTIWLPAGTTVPQAERFVATY